MAPMVNGNWQAVPSSVVQLTHGTGSVGAAVVVVGAGVLVTEKEILSGSQTRLLRKFFIRIR